MLEILVEIHRICVENNITYWLEAGTLLGAIRHKGFIPWDDDCDISMPRKDYERFLQIAQEKLPETMFLQTKETDKEYPLPWAKIRKNGTLLIETGETGEEKYHHGIFVDIFHMIIMSRRKSSISCCGQGRQKTKRISIRRGVSREC